MPDKVSYPLAYKPKDPGGHDLAIPGQELGLIFVYTVCNAVLILKVAVFLKTAESHINVI